LEFIICFEGSSSKEIIGEQFNKDKEDVNGALEGKRVCL